MVLCSLSCDPCWASPTDVSPVQMAANLAKLSLGWCGKKNRLGPHGWWYPTVASCIVHVWPWVKNETLVDHGFWAPFSELANAGDFQVAFF